MVGQKSKKQEYYFSTTVSEQFDKDEFIIEFTAITDQEPSLDEPIKVIKNFDELLDFLDQLDDF